MIHKYFHLLNKLTFNFVDCFFCCAETFPFAVVLLIDFCFGIISLPSTMSQISFSNFILRILWFYVYVFTPL